MGTVIYMKIYSNNTTDYIKKQNLKSKKLVFQKTMTYCSKLVLEKKQYQWQDMCTRSEDFTNHWYLHSGKPRYIFLRYSIKDKKTNC